MKLFVDKHYLAKEQHTYKACTRLCMYVLFGSLSLSGCDNSMDDKLILKPDGSVALPAELSAGYSTIFATASDAYDINADWVTGELEHRFNRGNNLYDRTRGTDNSSGGGLGPVYAGYSCSSCHKGAGLHHLLPLFILLLQLV